MRVERTKGYHIPYLRIVLILLPSGWNPFLISSGLDFEGTQIDKCSRSIVLNVEEDSGKLRRVNPASKVTKIKNVSLRYVAYFSSEVLLVCFSCSLFHY